MKALKLPLIAIALLTITSCEVTVNEGSEKKDEKKEVKNGFSYEDVSLTINGIEPVSNLELTAGENLIIHFTGVKNATLKDGFQHIGISLKIIDQEGNVLDDNEDLMSNIEQQDPALDNFRAFFGVPSSAIGNTIQIQYAIYDKYGTQSYSFDETYNVVKKDPPATQGTFVKSNIEGANFIIQLMNEETQFESAPASFNQEDEITLYINGVTGFKLKDGMLNASYAMTVSDIMGKIVFSQKEKLEGEIEAGVDSFPLYFSKEFTDIEPGSYTWNIEVKDNSSDKKIAVTAAINVQ